MAFVAEVNATGRELLTANPGTVHPVVDDVPFERVPEYRGGSVSPLAVHAADVAGSLDAHPNAANCTGCSMSQNR